MIQNPRPDLPHVVLGDGEEAHKGDAVRIGNGVVLWTIVDWNLAGIVFLRDDLTGSNRRIDRGRLIISAHECPLDLC